MSKHTILMGNPLFFRIKSGRNPHTRNAWGFKKKVDRLKAFEQWKVFKHQLESLGAHVYALSPQKEYPSMVYPANAGFLHPKHTRSPWKEKTFYLSRLTSHREDESLVYRHFFAALGVEIRNVNYAFEGEADFFPIQDGYIFTYGKLTPMGFKLRLGFPPWQYQFSHRSDKRMAEELQEIIGKKTLIKVRLIDTRFYHGDTCLFAFGKKHEYLMAYLEALDSESRTRLKKHFGKRLIALSKEDGQNFVANSFQLNTASGPHLILPHNTSQALIGQLHDMGLPTTQVNVSEFLNKGGGSIKCLLCDLGPYPA